MDNPQDMSNSNSMVEFIDEHGLRVNLPREEYIANALPNLIQDNWDHADRLASLIIDSFNFAIYAELESAAQHLLEIDNLPERAASLYGTILLKTQREAEAEEFYVNYLAEHPRHPYVLTNLAKAQAATGNDSEWLRTLEESLRADPNQDNAFEWWKLNKKEELEQQKVAPETAIIYALEQAKIRFGGWRVKLELGLEYLKQNDKDEAYKNYQEALSGQLNGEVLSVASMGLGRNGFLQEIIDLVEPAYDPELHDFMPALNILQAYLELQKAKQGKVFLDKLSQFENTEAAEELRWFQQEFAKMLGEPDPTLRQAKQDLDVDIVTINYPMWCYGWNIKHGFDTKQTNNKLAIFQFACDAAQSAVELAYELEDKPSQLARSIPLYLLDEIYYGTDGVADVILPVSKSANGCHVVFNDHPTVEQIMDLGMQGYTGILTGKISANNLQLSYWDLDKASRQDMECLFNVDLASRNIQQLKEFVFKHAGLEFDPNFRNDKRGFQAIPEQHLHDYLMLSSQHMTLKQAQDYIDSCNIHNLIRDYLKLAKISQNTQIQLSMLSIIHLCIRNDSVAIRDYYGVIAKWLDDLANSSSSVCNMAAKTLQVFKKYCAVE